MDIKDLPGAGHASIARLSGATDSGQVKSAGAIDEGALEEGSQASSIPRRIVEQAASSMEKASQNIKRDLKFSVDDETGQMVVKVTDASTGELIRQMPSEEALKLAQRLDEARSLLFKAKA